ncbi:MAG: hypothetical protein OEW42_15855 [Acidimicrobiia bacterium]|nr:hypothetical protein [Acidimicrobiia bacterium]
MTRRYLLTISTAFVLMVSLVAIDPAAAAAPTCGGQPATIVGTAGDDVIIGTDGHDVIHTGAGNDTIAGLQGRDIICSGTGDDLVRAGTGADRVLAGGGDDRVDTGTGDDMVRGGPGDDTLRGQQGNDRLLGNGGNDTVGGGSGVDRLFANDGDDQVLGHDGKDTLRGGPGADVMDGGPGDDLVVGSAQADLLVGGGGRDFLRGGAHDDRLEGGTEGDVLQGGRGDDALVGGPGDDYLDGGRGTDRCSDAAGADTAVCEGAAPPPGTFGCLPGGVNGVYLAGFNGWAADTRSRPRGPVVIVGDSLTFSQAAPVADRLARIGFGPICVDGVLSRSVRRAPAGYNTGVQGVARVRAAHPIWSSDATWIVSLGTNDSRFHTVLTPDAARTEAVAALDAIGPSASDRWWINVRTTQPQWQTNEHVWNAALSTVGDLGIIDWAGLSAGRPEWFFDGIHLTDEGNRRRLDLIEATITRGG